MSSGMDGGMVRVVMEDEASLIVCIGSRVTALRRSAYWKRGNGESHLKSHSMILASNPAMGGMSTIQFEPRA